jgi:CIC family chloride channel protein
VPNHVKPAIGGLAMGLLALGAPQILSTGYGWVQKAMTAHYLGWSLIFLALAKILAMSLTISSGGSGGVFGPNVYIGGMVGTWVAFVADKFLPEAHLDPSAFAVVGMAAVFAGTARVPIATLVMVAEMTGGYGLIVPSMLATTVAFVVQRTVGSRFRYDRLYESQVELRSDSPTHHERVVRAAFNLLQRESSVNLRELEFPQLEALIRHSGSLRIHGGEARLFAVHVANGSALAGKSVAEVFASLPDLVVIAAIREQAVLVPRGTTRLAAGDHLLITSATGSGIDAVRALAEGGGKR